MQNEPRDKKPMPGDDYAAPDEKILADKIPELNKEQDIDDLVHNTSSQEINPFEEIDADDAIHHTTNKISSATGDEVDPDDLVHGN